MRNLQVLEYVLITIVLSLFAGRVAYSQDTYTTSVVVSVETDTAGIAGAYSIAKSELCRKALLDALRGDDKAILRSVWERVGSDKIILEKYPEFFRRITIIEKNLSDAELGVRAEVVVDINAVEGFIEDNLQQDIADINDVGMTVLFLSRTSDMQIDFQKVVTSDTFNEKQEGAGSTTQRVETTQRQTEFTTKTVDPTELVANISANLIDSGIKIYSLGALIPYIQDSARMEGYIAELERSFAGYVDASGKYKSGEIEKGIAFIQKDIKSLSPHPRYFALGKIDLGNTTQIDGQFRSTGACSITLWDLDSGLFPVKIASTPLITAVGEAIDKKEAQKIVAEKSATKAGKMILMRIRAAMLFGADSKYNAKLTLEEQIAFGQRIDVDESALYGLEAGNTQELFAKAVQENAEMNYAQAVEILFRLAREDYAPAMTMLGELYFLGNGVARDKEEACNWYKRAIAAGDTHALFKLGVQYLTGLGVTLDQVEGIRLLTLAAEKGDLDAINELAGIYFEGLGVPKDYAKALEWYYKGVELNSDKAMFGIGNAYFFGKGVEQDYAKARVWYNRAAHLGLREAYYNLGHMNEYGLGQDIDMQKALEYYQLAADKGMVDAITRLAAIFIKDPYRNYEEAMRLSKKAAALHDGEAMVVLGNIYENGYGVEKNYAEALKWYLKAGDKSKAEGYHNAGLIYYFGRAGEPDIQKAVEYFALAAEQGFAFSKYFLGSAYIEGEGVDKDISKGFALIESAAEGGIVNAQSDLGYIYSEGVLGEVDFSKALKWYKLAADNNNPVAMYNLAMMYYEGMGTDVDKEMAVDLFKKASAAGELQATAQLGNIYLEGDGVERDIAKAIEYYKVSAERDFVYSYNRLGLIYRDDEYGMEDPFKAAGYFRKAAELGSVDGMYWLALMYEKGMGISRDPVKALEWFRKAAEGGDKYAQWRMGAIYEHGDLGVVFDYKTAVEWYKLAAAQGHERSIKKVDELRYAY